MWPTVGLAPQDPADPTIEQCVPIPFAGDVDPALGSMRPRVSPFNQVASVQTFTFGCEQQSTTTATVNQYNGPVSKVEFKLERDLRFQLCWELQTGGGTGQLTFTTDHQVAVLFPIIPGSPSFQDVYSNWNWSGQQLSVTIFPDGINDCLGTSGSRERTAGLVGPITATYDWVNDMGGALSDWSGTGTQTLFYSGWPVTQSNWTGPGLLSKCTGPNCGTTGLGALCKDGGSDPNVSNVRLTVTIYTP